MNTCVIESPCEHPDHKTNLSRFCDSSLLNKWNSFAQVRFNISLDPASVHFKYKNVQWMPFDSYDKPYYEMYNGIDIMRDQINAATYFDAITIDMNSIDNYYIDNLTLSYLDEWWIVYDGDQHRFMESINTITETFDLNIKLIVNKYNRFSEVDEIASLLGIKSEIIKVPNIFKSIQKNKTSNIPLINKPEGRYYLDKPFHEISTMFLGKDYINKFYRNPFYSIKKIKDFLNC
ncbi:hypothetical protein GCM10008934_20960 [Virgibacillus salarius]